jgi:Subtilase family
MKPPRAFAGVPSGLALLGLLLIGCLGPAGAGAAPPGDGNLSPRLEELATPAVRALEPAALARRLSLARSGPASLQRLGNRILVSVRFEAGAAAGAEALRQAGAEVLDVSGRLQTVTAAAEPGDLAALGTVPGVAGVTEVLTPIVRGADCGGLVRSEGDTQLSAASARASWGVDGSGVTVGILSDSFDRDGLAATHAAQDVASGDLPGPGGPCGSSQPVGVLDDGFAAGEDEGRAMAQIVHDLAPGAAIDFASAFGDQIGFANNIRALAGAGVRVIADDVIYLEEPFFQDGPVAVAINEAVASGVSYFTAAGNDNIRAGGNDVNSFEAPFADAGSCPAGVPAAECADFDPGPGKDDDYDLTVGAGQKVLLDLQWAEPWGGVGTDLDAYLLNGSGTVLAKATSRNVTQSQRPFEALSWTNEGKAPVTVELAIPRLSGSANPRLKFVQLGNGSQGVAPTPAQYTTSSAGATIGPTVLGHSVARSAISTAAVAVGSTLAPEAYSSRGPVVHFFGPVTGVAPAPPLPAEEVIPKPDLAASDCGVTTFFASFVKAEGVWRFCGTSAAAPHAAAVAALMRQANPGAGAGQIRAALLGTARAVGSSGPDEVGAGLVDAFAAVDAVALPPAIAFSEAPQALSRNRRPTIQFGANRPVAFACSLDGSAPQPCASPYTVPAPLADGSHGFAVTGTDIGGRVGSSPVVAFKIDTRSPRTKIVKHPPKLVRTKQRRARVVFRFRTNESGASFICKTDHDLLRPCASRLVLRLLPGRHRIRVRARDLVGNVDPSAAVFNFRVKQVG